MTLARFCLCALASCVWLNGPTSKLEGSEPEYRIPAAGMKVREQHVVLSTQAVEILKELHAYSGGAIRFSIRETFTRAISDKTIMRRHVALDIRAKK